MIVPIPNRNYWSALGRLVRDQESWHALSWADNPRYLELVDFAAHTLGIDRPFYFQAEPNLRIQEPGEIAVPWHTDADFGHQVAEMNVWVPLTWIIDDSQRVWLDRGGSPFAPKVQLGEALIFPGAAVRHGNHVNTTTRTRRSMDFRLVLAEEFTETDNRTVVYDVPMTVGGYWRGR